MEVRPIIDLDREATPDQMGTLMDGVEASLDHVVADTLVPTTGYAGMAATFAGTVVTIGAGRLYNGGKVYAYDTAGTFDMITQLPAATKRAVLFVAFGTESDTDVAEVNFLIEATSTPAAPSYQPKAVATNHRRLAIVQPAFGAEAPNPVQPDPGLAVPVALAVLTPTGIASLVNIATDAVPVLAQVAARTTALEAFEAAVGPQVSSLASDLANLANAVKGATDPALTGRILLAIADLDAKVGIPSNAADSSADYLLDGTNSDLAHPLSSCQVQEGIRFADDGAADAVLNLFNPFEAAGVVKSGVLLPAYTRYLRTTTGAITGSVPANSYTYNPVSYTQKTMSRTRVRYGTAYDVCSNSAFWRSGTYDPLSSIFTLPDGETFKAAADNLAYGSTVGYYSGAGPYVAVETRVRVQQFWTDTVSETYWDQVIQAPQTIAGYHLAETVLIGQDQWIDAVGVTLSKLDASGDVDILVCQAGDNATPDPSSVLARVHLPFASLVAGAETVAALPTPVLLSAGNRISIIIVTPAAHAVATTDGASFPQGTFFVLSPSGYAQGDLTKHLALNLYGCKFSSSVASIQLQNLQLAGGMASIDILAGTVVPACTALTYEVQLGGVWVPLSGITAGQLNAGGALPPNVPLRVTFAGTPDMMPAIDLAHSNAHVSRPKTSLAHVWPKLPRTPPVSTSQIRVIERYESYDPTQHSWAAKLLTGTGYTTQTAPSSFTDVLGADGSLERTYVFNLPSAVSSYKVLTTATATTPLDVDLGAWIKDYVL